MPSLTSDLNPPLAAFAAPENPLFPSASNNREPPKGNSHRSMAQAWRLSNPLMADAVGAIEIIDVKSSCVGWGR